MKILVVGAGSIGRRHIRNLNVLGHKNIDLAEPAPRPDLMKGLAINETYPSLTDALGSGKNYDAAFICTPPVYHLPAAVELAKRKTDIFIEKPLSQSLKGVDTLNKTVKKNRVIAMVGYNQRFNFGIRRIKSCIEEGCLGRKLYYIRAEVGQYLPDWRPEQDYRKNYTAIKKLGGGIILDASHEIDYVLWLSGSRVSDLKAIYCKVSDLETDVEDLAEIIMRFENGLVASIHLDMVTRGYNRYCKVVGEKGQIKWTFKEDTLETHTSGKKPATKKYKLDPNHSYIEELKHFLNCVKSRSTPLSNLETAKETLEIVEKIKGGR